MAVSPHPAALPLRRFQAARGQLFPSLTTSAIAQSTSSSAFGFRGPLARPSFTIWAARPLSLAPRCPISSGFHSRAAYPGSPNRLPAVPSVPGSHSPLAAGAPQSPLSSASEPAHLRGGSRAARTQLGAGVRGPRRVSGAQRLERQTQSPGRGVGAQAGASSATRGHRSGTVGAPPPAAASRTGTTSGGGAYRRRGGDKTGREQGKPKERESACVRTNHRQPRSVNEDGRVPVGLLTGVRAY